jgi:hypothetical protein
MRAGWQVSLVLGMGISLQGTARAQEEMLRSFPAAAIAAIASGKANIADTLGRNPPHSNAWGKPRRCSGRRPGSWSAWSAAIHCLTC